MGGEGWGDWVKKHLAGMNGINGIRIFLFVEGGALLTGEVVGWGGGLGSWSSFLTGICRQFSRKPK